MEKQMQEIILFFVFILMQPSSGSKAQAFMKDDNIISAGYGLGSLDIYTNGDFTTDNDYNTSYTGPFYLKYEHALTDKLAMGVDLAYAYYNSVPGNPYYNEYGQTLSTFSGLLRLNWHFATLDKLDPYFGLGLGYRTDTFTKYSSANATTQYSNVINNFFPIGFEATIGLRYYITNNVAFYIETGVAKSAVQVGMAFKVK